MPQNLFVVAKSGGALVSQTDRQGATPRQLQLRAPAHRRAGTADSILQKVQRGRVALETVSH
jgi:hypothetical protein